MRRRLLVAVSVAALCSSPVWADEEISNERTSPVRTSTSGDVVITSSGRVTLTGQTGPAVVVDSDNSVETAGGSGITIADQSNATGILLEGGRTGELIHRGNLTLGDSEFRNTVPVNEAILDLTDESGKTGIQISTAGGAPFNGNVTIAGGSTLTVIGNDSYGIRAQGGLNGNLALDGSLSVGGRDSFGGQIVTIKCFEDNSLVKEQVELDGKGKVLVVDGQGSRRRALCGGNIAALAQEHGWEGLVYNGCIRDQHEFTDLDFGVKAIGTTPMRPRTDGIVKIGVPLYFGGIVINDGDYLYADVDGIIVGPKPLHD